MHTQTYIVATLFRVYFADIIAVTKNIAHITWGKMCKRDMYLNVKSMNVDVMSTLKRRLIDIVTSIRCRLNVDITSSAGWGAWMVATKRYKSTS